VEGPQLPVDTTTLAQHPQLKPEQPLLLVAEMEAEVEAEVAALQPYQAVHRQFQ
jgi:hypothetical protein